MSSPANASLHREHVLYENIYMWLIFLAAMDCIMTWMILQFGGHEVNQIANAVLERWDMKGMVFYKFILIGFVIFCCEAVGRRRMRTGWRLATFSVVASCVPVSAAFAQL